jgi:RNA 3'-terminal phosphate cyclase
MVTSATKSVKGCKTRVAVTTTSGSVATGVGVAVWAEVDNTHTSAAKGTAKRANKKASFINK